MAGTTFDFSATATDTTDAYHGNAVESSLTVFHSALWHRADLVNVEPYGAPEFDVWFELGHDNITIIPGTGGNVDGTDYDLNFSPDNTIDSQGYDINFAQADDIIIKSYSWDFMHVPVKSTMSVDLDTDRYVLENDLPVCGFSTGKSVRQLIVSDQLLNNTLQFTSDSKITHDPLEFRFDEFFENCQTEILLQPVVNDFLMTVDLDFSCIEVDQLSLDFDLNTSDSQSTEFVFNTGYITDCVYGKNLKYDIFLCSDDSNPTLNIFNHDFESLNDFLAKECGIVYYDIAHGSTATVQFTIDIIINDVNGSHGHYSNVDLSLTANFKPDFYAGHLAKVNTFTTFPAALFDGMVYFGSTMYSELSTIAIIRDVDADHGSTLDAVIEVFEAPQLPADIYHGSSAGIELLTAPVIQVDYIQHGHTLSSGFTSYPAIEFDVDVYHGANADGVVVVYPQFDAIAHHGGYSETELLTIEGEGLGEIDGYHGFSSDSDLAYTPTIDAEAYHGGYSDALLNFSTSFDLVGYHGAYVEGDLTRVEAPEFEPVAYHGASPEFTMAVTKALFPRGYAGMSADVDFTNMPGDELSLEFYNGVYAEFDIVESEFNTFAYHGATVEDTNLQVTVNIPAEVIHGSYASVDMSYTPTLEPVAYHGAEGFTSNFTVPQGETILANAAHGQSLTPDLHAPIHARLSLHPIVASQTLYDGLGGVGGLNHCYLATDDLDPIWGDNVTRLGFDIAEVTDQLIIRFDDIGDDPWTTCNGGGQEFEVAFQTLPRFEAQAYAGESVKLFFPLEVMPLFGYDIPLDRLYTWEYWAVIVREVFELEEIQIQTGAVAWNHPDDVVAFHEAYFHAELTPTAFAPMFNGEYGAANLSVPIYPWKHAQQPFGHGLSARIEFEPVEYVRFCKGYIVPNGNSVVFEFASEDDTDCSIWLAAFGQSLNKPDLSAYPNMDVEFKANARMDFYLTTQTYWTLYARHGHIAIAQFYNEEEFELTMGHGSYALTEFYEPPVHAYSGAVMLLDEFIVPGAGIEWETETGCLENQYKPLTEDGDIDYEAMEPDENGVEHYLPVPVEGKPYLTAVIAKCITYTESQNGD